MYSYILKNITEGKYEIETEFYVLKCYFIPSYKI